LPSGIAVGTLAGGQEPVGHSDVGQAGQVASQQFRDLFLPLTWSSRNLDGVIHVLLKAQLLSSARYCMWICEVTYKSLVVIELMNFYSPPYVRVNIIIYNN